MRLFLHIGHGKTGSSFLQSWLAENADLITSRTALVYPLSAPGVAITDQRALQGRFSQGNGALLDSLLKQRDRPRRMRRFLRSLAQERSVVGSNLNGLVFSFEGWVKQFDAMVDALMALADVWEVEYVEVFLVVRDPLEHACSVYSQVVKRHGYTGSLDQWLQSYAFPNRLLRALEAMALAGSRFRLTAIHYGRQRQHLVRECQSWLGLDSADAWASPQTQRVNRSLTLDELELMRVLNSRIGDAAAVVGEHLVDRLPDLMSAVIKPSDHVVKSFLCRWVEPIQLINTYLPPSAHLQLLELGSSGHSDSAPELSQEVHLSMAQLQCLVDGLIDADVLLRSRS
jgi:hypothetical protein